MICETAAHLAVYARGNPYQSTADFISYATNECALGRVLVARTVAGVCAILIGTAGDLEADLAARFSKAKLVTNAVKVHDDLAKVIRFVDRPAEGLDLPLDLRGTPFQWRVWEKLRAIPLGRTVTDYRWGVERKHELLRKEAMA